MTIELIDSPTVMLTRLKVDGFKNLLDVDIRLGPFTCVAGANGVGKSNLFDAIGFLSQLSDKTFVEAASSIRSEGNGGSEISDLFYQNGHLHRDLMRFEADIIIPTLGEDHLGQPAEATITFLRYILELKYRKEGLPVNGNIELVHEELTYITKSDAPANLPFAKGKVQWRESVIKGKRSGREFISTETKDGKTVIKLHQDGRSGRAKSLLADRLPRTVLSDVSASETPTALLARQEFRSWQFLQLEPSAMRKPDEFDAPSHLSMKGANLAKTLFVLANQEAAVEDSLKPDLYRELSNKLSELVNDIDRVFVERDPKRELLTLKVCGKDGVAHPARSLSDGTLRFLALAVLEMSGDAQVLCLEEPENGIHPQRIQAMLNLLEDIAIDLDFPVAGDNILRQVIINTHSPGVVEEVSEDSLLVAEPAKVLDSITGVRCDAVRYVPIAGTWRAQATPAGPVAKMIDLMAYLSRASTIPYDRTGQTTVKQRVERQLQLRLG